MCSNLESSRVASQNDAHKGAEWDSALLKAFHCPSEAAVDRSPLADVNQALLIRAQTDCDSFAFSVRIINFCRLYPSLKLEVRSLIVFPLLLSFLGTYMRPSLQLFDFFLLEDWSFRLQVAEFFV